MEENFNKHLGNKLKLRRLALGLTQTKVAKAINVTFQQIQKYEKGTNGVSSIRLLQLSNYLKVPISYFFIVGTKLGYQGFNNVLWAQRLLGFGLGIFIFAVCTWFFMGEGITNKTIVSLVLALVLVMIQVFWR